MKMLKLGELVEIYSGQIMSRIVVDSKTKEEGIKFRVITPNIYKLFQAADLICTLALIKNKLISGKALTNSEEIFFGSSGKLRKNYLRSVIKNISLSKCARNKNPQNESGGTCKLYFVLP